MVARLSFPRSSRLLTFAASNTDLKQDRPIPEKYGVEEPHNDEKPSTWDLVQNKIFSDSGKIQMVYSANVAPRIRLHANLLDYLLDICDIS